MRRVVLAASVVLVLFAAPDARAQSDTTPPLAAPGRLIDNGGWKLHLNCSGTAQPGRPTVILEALGQVKHYVAYGPGAMQMEAEELALMVTAERQQPQPLKDKPLTVLTAGRNEFRADEQALEEDRLMVQAALVRLSSNGKQIIVRDSGHHIHIEQPEIVVRAIRDAVGTSARSGRIVAKR